MSDVEDHFDNIESDFSQDETPFETPKGSQSLLSGEEELETFRNQQEDRNRNYEEERSLERKDRHFQSNSASEEYIEEQDVEGEAVYLEGSEEEASEYEYVIDGGLENEDQEIYLDVNFPEYMVSYNFIYWLTDFRFIYSNLLLSPATSRKLGSVVR